MNASNALGGLALAVGLALGPTLPAAAEPPEGVELAQAPADAPRPGPGMGQRPQWGQEGHGSMHGHHRGWHHHGRRHHFSLASVALRHQKDLGLSPAQVDTLRKLTIDARRDAIKRKADVQLARLDLGTLMMPDPADPNKPRDMAKIEAKVREIEKLRADGSIARIRNMEQSRQTLTPEQREKLRAMFAERWQRGPKGPMPSGQRGMGPQDGGTQPTASPETDGSAG
jgi:Spy/CpxP family protein refolding chaperone